MHLRLFLDVDGTKVVEPGASSEWKLSPKVMERGVAEGWMSFGRGHVTLHTKADSPDVVFKVHSAPKLDRDGNEDRTRNFYDLVRVEG